jgi:phytoene desaturase
MSHHDAIVIGSGVGGLVAAAHLALRGRRPLVLEREQRLGGRFSTVERDGFKLPTGAVAIETGGPFWETFIELGIGPGLRVPDPAVRVRVRGRDLAPGAAVWDHLIKRVTKAAGLVAEGVALREDVDDAVMLDAWVRRYTRSTTVHSLFQSLSAAIFTVNANELPAGIFFRNLRETGGYKKFGFAPHGNVVIAEALADAIVERGGEVRTGCEVTAIEADADRAIGVRLGHERLTSDAIVSNAGPRATAALVEGPSAQGFADRVRSVRSTSLLALAFSTTESVVPHPGIWAFTDTRRLCNLANLSATCPELAPPGRTLYEAYSAPRPSVGGAFDEATERTLLESDLRDVVPGFEHATVVRFKAMRGEDTPAQRCAPGADLDVRTPLTNLVEVGDGVKPYGWIGTTACARSAQLAVAALESST